MRAFAIFAILCFVVVTIPSASARVPWTCVDGPRFFACAGEYDWGDDAPGCAVTGAYAWVVTGTSAGAYGMGCESGYRANGAGGTLANTTGVGLRWQSGECAIVYVANYIDYSWTEVPVCALGEPVDGVDWGHLTP